MRANRKIAKGEFVEEYTGERVLTEYHRSDRLMENWYAFMVDHPLYKQVFEVDARFFGNFTRFINHSCQPNVSSYPVLTDVLDVVPARTCFFAKEDIGEGEELTLDYNYKVDYDVSDPQFSVKCNCGSNSCRGYLIRC